MMRAARLSKWRCAEVRRRDAELLYRRDSEVTILRDFSCGFGARRLPWLISPMPFLLFFDEPKFRSLENSTNIPVFVLQLIFS